MSRRKPSGRCRIVAPSSIPRVAAQIWRSYWRTRCRSGFGNCRLGIHHSTSRAWFICASHKSRAHLYIADEHYKQEEAAGDDKDAEEHLHEVICRIQRIAERAAAHVNPHLKVNQRGKLETVIEQTLINSDEIMERGTQGIPHGHYTPEEWKHNSIHGSVDIADNGNCKCINTETEIASEGVCSSLEALRVKLGVLSPGHSAWVMQGLNSRSRDGIGAAHVYILTIDHVLALEVDAGFHALDCQEVPYRPCSLPEQKYTARFKTKPQATLPKM